MSDNEFGDQAASIATRIRDLQPEDRIAAACRGSGNPVALAWLAESLRLDERARVTDLGAGLGGPAAWLRSRYRCSVTAVEPELQAASAGRSLFALPTVVAAADAAPFADDSFDAALLLGVVSVLDDPRTALSEAARLADRLGILDYCSTEPAPVRAGGSTFRTEQQLCDLVASLFEAHRFAMVTIDAPQPWSQANDAVHATPDPDEADVTEAIEAGRIAPFMLVASRR
ncbi:MAG: methyltransferase domain-containing protein [Ilumatobacteraceae bacterium]